jgi:hypothetical protein
LLFGQAGNRDGTDLIGTVAVGFLNRRGIDTPEAGEQARCVFRTRFDPFSGLGELAENDIQGIAMAICKSG